jgi:hypothetical protein
MVDSPMHRWRRTSPNVIARKYNCPTDTSLAKKVNFPFV